MNPLATASRRAPECRSPWRAVGAVALALASPGPAQAQQIPAIAVDVGHTLAAPGAISARGRSEFDFNRELAGRLVAALERLGLRAELINADGRIESLQARPERAAQAVFLISIHHDSVSERYLTPWEWQGQALDFSDRWAGHSLFVSRRNPDVAASLMCASAIGARLQRSGFMPTDKNARRREYADAQHAVHYYDNLVVLYGAHQPAVLFEAGVIKHRDEELLLRDPERQQRMADEIATGVAACVTAGGIAAAPRTD
ncbi:N-acetylmuramoyl-L-alanine amidase [Aromatoleum toluclasticum]|uniref:N-acetylmuramoyl-L-alanine amidase n=1 Tax=Aromatoleum toluclasticum TaxID=92003 RepID=UPI00037CFF15|nr:N-acetylmuramoyl-L-alanine amidase [Aromatoleum toluclasticum]